MKPPHFSSRPSTLRPRFFAGGLILALFFHGCATSSLDGEVVPFENSGSLETVVLLGTNDLHGALAPARMKTADNPPVDYEKGGAAIFASHVRILRRQYGDRLLLLDGGDHFQGSIDSNLEEGRPMVQFFNELGFTASVIGNHEFDFGPEGSKGELSPAKIKGKDLRGTLKARIKEARYPYLAANIYDKKSGEFPGIPGTRASILVRAGKLRIGIVGLTTLDTPTTTRPEYVRDLEFRDMAKVATAESAKLRADGAHVVVALTHSGVFCTIPTAPDRGAKTGMIKSESDFQTGCLSNHELPELLRKVPKGTFDAVVSGHTHSLVHHWIEGIPVIQGGTQNAYYNLIYLTYDWDKKSIRTDKTRIEGPLPICPKIFANQKNCNGEAPVPEKGRGKLVAARLRGVEIEPDSSMEKLLAPVFSRTEEKKGEVIGQLARPLPHIREEESPLGNLVADAIRDSIGADIGIMNPGGIRANWESGTLRYADVFRTLPFDNYVSKLTLTGKELRRFVRITHAGARGFFSTSGLKVRAIRREDEPRSSDLNGDRKISPWELDRLIEVTTAGGDPIQDGKTYTVATIDFLVSGGDSMGWFMNGIPKERIQPIAGPLLRDAVIEYVQKRMQSVSASGDTGINSEKNPVVKANSPRLVLEKRQAAVRSKKARRRSSKKRR